MSANAQDCDFGEYDKPGAERSRRRRGEDDDLESDLEEELLEEDWLSGKKNPSDASDEELNDDLLQSDDEDINASGQDVSINASYSLGTSYEEQDKSQEAHYTDENVGAEGFGVGEGYQDEAYAEGYGQDGEMAEDHVGYGGEGDDDYQDEVLDIQINEPIDGEFQDEEDPTSYDEPPVSAHGVRQEEAPEEEFGGAEEGADEPQQEGEEAAGSDSLVYDTEMVESDVVGGDTTKEESDEEDDEDEESGRLRFKSERKDGAVVRLSDSSKRRSIPETLELSEKAKQDLREFEEQERQKRQNRYGGRGGWGARGGRGRGFHPYGMADFRGGFRGKMNDHRPPLMGHMGKLPSSQMPLPHHLHHQQMQQQHHHHQPPHHQHPHHPLRSRGPAPFQEHGRPIAQQPLQPLIPPHMMHRSPPLRPQMEPPPRMMNSPPPNFPPHHQQQQPQQQQQQQQQQQAPQPKNIHINPHFRGSASSSVQVPLMPPAQSQPRPAVSPQRFPGVGEFQQHLPGNFGQPQRPPHHMEPFRNQPPQGPQEREPLFMGERTESTRFPGLHMFDHQGPSPLMSNNHNLHHQQQQQQQQQLPGQGHMGFGPPGPGFNQPGQGPLGLFPREPPRPPPPHQGHQGVVNLNQGGPPNQPRPFMGPRQPFGQQGNPFPPPQVQFGMQVRQRGAMHGSLGSQPPHHDPMPSHQPMHQHQHHHRQELAPHHHQQQQQQPQQQNINQPRPVLLHGPNPFHHQQMQGSPRPMALRPQNHQQRNMPNRQRMNVPMVKQMQPRNSNLRELPVAPGNAGMNSGPPASNARPVAKATPGLRPGQSAQPFPVGGRGRGHVAAKPEMQPGAEGGGAFRKEPQSTQPSTAPQQKVDPDEDEETRQYRLKIEEQKRRREEVLRAKEMRRQMQAGVRKKELLNRLNATDKNPPQAGPAQQSQPTAPPVPHQAQQQQQQPQPQPQLLLQQQQRHVQQQAPLSQRPQPCNPPPNHPPQCAAPSPNGGAQTAVQRPNVKARLQMARGGAQPQQVPGPGPEPQWRQNQQNQQLNQQQQQQQQQQQALLPGNSAVQNRIRPSAPPQLSQNNVPLTPPMGNNQHLKRTVMQRSKNPGAESQPVLAKVRVVKLSGAGPQELMDTDGQSQQQDTWADSAAAVPQNPANLRKVSMTGQQQQQQQQGAGRAPQASPGVMGNQQQNRVVLSGRGRGKWAGPMGRGRPPAVRASPRVDEAERRTVSIEGLSSSTTDVQLKNLLRSMGPIEMFKLMPQQRKAVAKFTSPEHAANFQMSFHRHMIDLSHIDVALIDG